MRIVHQSPNLETFLLGVSIVITRAGHQKQPSYTSAPWNALLDGFKYLVAWTDSEYVTSLD